MAHARDALRPLLGCALLGAMLASAAVGAAPAPEPAADVDQAAAETTQGADRDDGAAAEAGAEPAAAAVETPDVFIPSVEVSEDLSVAFPVDI